MTQNKAFDRDALAIGKLMQKHNSIGVIEDGHGNQRLFCNGNIEAIIKGLALALAHVCETCDDDCILDEVAEGAEHLLAQRRGGVIQ